MRAQRHRPPSPPCTPACPYPIYSHVLQKGRVEISNKENKRSFPSVWAFGGTDQPNLSPRGWRRYPVENAVGPAGCTAPVPSGTHPCPQSPAGPSGLAGPWAGSRKPGLGLDPTQESITGPKTHLGRCLSDLDTMPCPGSKWAEHDFFTGSHERLKGVMGMSPLPQPATGIRGASHIQHLGRLELRHWDCHSLPQGCHRTDSPPHTHTFAATAAQGWKACRWYSIICPFTCHHLCPAARASLANVAD